MSPLHLSRNILQGRVLCRRRLIATPATVRRDLLSRHTRSRQRDASETAMALAKQRRRMQ